MPEASEIIAVAPPAPEWVERLLALYGLWDGAHASGPWARDLGLRLTLPPETTRSLDRFYVSPYGNEVAAALDVTRSSRFAGLAAVHRVFTHPAMRRKGLARGLVERAKSDFRAAGGRLLILVAPEKGPARSLYAEAGFQEVARASDGEALLAWPARGRQGREAALRFVRHPPVRWRPADMGDWASLVLATSLVGLREPRTVLDVEWIPVLAPLEGDEEHGAPSRPRGEWTLSVGESRHGYVVAARTRGPAPGWLRSVLPPEVGGPANGMPPGQHDHRGRRV